MKRSLCDVVKCVFQLNGRFFRPSSGVSKYNHKETEYSVLADGDGRGGVVLCFCESKKVA